MDIVFTSKEQIIDYATQLQCLYFSLDGSDKYKHEYCHHQYNFINHIFIDCLLHEEFTNFCKNIVNYNIRDFKDAIMIFGQCQNNNFEDGYPIDPITQEQLTNWKNIGISNGCGYSKESIIFLTRSGFDKNPITNAKLSSNEFEDRAIEARIRPDELHNIYNEGIEETTTDFFPKKLNFDEDLDI